MVAPERFRHFSGVIRMETIRRVDAEEELSIADPVHAQHIPPILVRKDALASSIF